MDRTRSVDQKRSTTGEVFVRANEAGVFKQASPVTRGKRLAGISSVQRHHEVGTRIVQEITGEDERQGTPHELRVATSGLPPSKSTITALALDRTDTKGKEHFLAKNALVCVLLTFTHCFDENASTPDTVALMLSVFSIYVSLEPTDVVTAGELSGEFTVKVQEVTREDVEIHLHALHGLWELIAQDEFLDIDAYAKQHADVRCPPWLRPVLPVNMTTSYTEILMRNLSHSPLQFRNELAFIMMGLAILGDAKANVSPAVYQAYMEARKETLIAISGGELNRRARYSAIVYPRYSFVTMLKTHTSVKCSIRHLALLILFNSVDGRVGVNEPYGQYILERLKYSDMTAVSLVIRQVLHVNPEAFMLEGLARELAHFDAGLQKYGELDRDRGKYVPNATWPYVGYLKLDGVEHLSWRALGTLAGVAVYMARLDDKRFNNVSCPSYVLEKADSPVGKQLKHFLLMSKFGTTDIASIRNPFSTDIAKRLSTEVVAEDSINTCAKKRRL